MDIIASHHIEIRAPRAAVLAWTHRPRDAARWTWPEALVGDVQGDRDLPDGAYQRSNAGGDRFRDRIVEQHEAGVVIENALLPKEKGVPGRTLLLKLDSEARGGATKVTLGVAFADKSAPTAPTEVRRWRRHAEQCLARLQVLVEAGSDASAGAETEP